MPVNIKRHLIKAATAVRRNATAKAFGLLRRRDRGSMSVMLAVVVIPVLVGVGTLAIGQGYYGYRHLLLQQTVQNAALAAGNKISTYYANHDSSTVVSTAQAFAASNMPSAQYGTVVQPSGVVLGNLSGTTFTALSGANVTPDAVQVTGLNTAANGNPVALFLGNWFGKPTVDMTIKVTASYGTGQPFNTIVINDMSQSFSAQLSNQKTADQAILDCVRGMSGSSSYFGLTMINGHSTLFQPLILAGANYSTLQTKITSITSSSCGSNCSTGSNISSGMYSAIQQFSSGFTGTKKNIIIITDGIPNAGHPPYSIADGVPTVNGVATCLANCQDIDLQNGAKQQAAAAAAAGIAISTIYYSGEGGDTATNTAYLASLKTLTGVSMVAPTSGQISATIAGFCATMPSALKVVM